MTGVKFTADARYFSLFHVSRPALGPTQLYIKWILGVLSPRVKRPRREVDHSPPFSAEVKNEEAVTPLPICLHGTVLHSIIKYRDNYIFSVPLTFTLFIIAKPGS
jgi:hypothetical protein